MLQECGVNPLSTLEREFPKVRGDPRFQRLDKKGRNAAFARFREERAAAVQEEMVAAKQRVRDGFFALLAEAKVGAEAEVEPLWEPDVTTGLTDPNIHGVGGLSERGPQGREGDEGVFVRKDQEGRGVEVAQREGR